MKNLVLKLFAIVLVFNVSSCSIEKKIIGKWYFENIETSKKFSPKNQERYNKQLAVIINNSFLKFNDDSKYEIKFNNKKAIGFWNYQKDKNIITTKIEGSKKIDIAKIIEISSTKLILEVKKKDENLKFYLTKKPNEKKENISKTDK